LFTDINLYNTLVGLILPSLTFALPLAVYILTSFFKEIPRELEEAALVDGATHFQAFTRPSCRSPLPASCRPGC
jgi:multiple sugar transport system permease protein